VARPRCLGATRARPLRRAPAPTATHARRPGARLRDPSRAARSKSAHPCGGRARTCCELLTFELSVQEVGVSRCRWRWRVAPRQGGRATVRAPSSVPLGSRRVSAIAAGDATPPPTGRDADQTAMPTVRKQPGAPTARLSDSRFALRFILERSPRRRRNGAVMRDILQRFASRFVYLSVASDEARAAAARAALEAACKPDTPDRRAAK
jgi:hypothetical protein